MADTHESAARRIPFLLYGDGPRLPTGLARIARDLGMRLAAEADELGIDFAQVGVDYPGGWAWQGWDFCGFQPNPTDQGREAVESCLQEMNRRCGRAGVLLMIMDPARCWDLTRTLEAPNPEGGIVSHTLPAQTWGYYPLDATNRNGIIGGPAARCVLDTERLLGYGRWGAQVLQRTRVFRDAPLAPVPYLPHGLDTRIFCPGVPLAQADPGFSAWAAGVPESALRIGCVATNQPRKDLGLLFQAVAALKREGHPIALWLHTDKPTAAWDIGELAYTCGLAQHEVAASVDELNDRQLAARYGWSHVTLAPGLGEGFGYPIVESLACGTPVVHGQYAGGVELIPDPRWLVPAEAWRLESVYALRRPVFDPEAVAARLEQVGNLKAESPELVQAYCSGSVAHLDWQYLWDRWRAWIVQGLAALREAQ